MARKQRRNKSPVRQAQKPANNLEQKQAAHKLHTVSEHRSFQGPLPPPEILEHYNAIEPGLADRIVSMAEREATARHLNEQKSLDANISLNHRTLDERKRGQHYGLAVTVVALASATALGLNGAETAAGIIGGATVVSLASVFVIGKIFKKKDSSEE